LFVDTLWWTGVTTLGPVQAGFANDFEPVVGSFGLANDESLGGFLGGHGCFLDSGLFYESQHLN
jgi:hypothetical protein